MIWLKSRANNGLARVNSVLAFKHCGFQLQVNEKTGRNGWVIDLIPGVGIARNDWIHIGFDISWLIVSLSFFIAKPRFMEGIIQERNYQVKQVEMAKVKP